MLDQSEKEKMSAFLPPFVIHYASPQLAADRRGINKDGMSCPLEDFWVIFCRNNIWRFPSNSRGVLLRVIHGS